MAAANQTECLLDLASKGFECDISDGVCVALNETEYICGCYRGKFGNSCENLVIPGATIYAVNGVLYFACFFFFLFLVWRRNKKTGWAELEAARLKGVLSAHPNLYGDKVIAFWRLAALVFAMYIHLDSIVDSSGFSYRAYTVWNFITLNIYFGLGLGLSLFSAAKGPEAIKESKYMSFNAKLHYLLLEIELPNTLLVDVVFWALLFPGCGAPCASFGSIVQHGVNFALMTIDFLLTRHAFNPGHFFIMIILPVLYAIFHLFWTLSRDPIVGHQPVYFFLDMTNNLSPIWVIGVLILHMVFFFLFFAIGKYALKRNLADVQDDEQTIASNQIAAKEEPDAAENGVPAKNLDV